MSYSQGCEDDIVAAQFRLDFRGNLLEIGAWEPVNFSNSRLLIERGWDATLVEFSPLAVDKLIREYPDNPKVRVIQAAITPIEAHVQRFSITEDALSAPEAEGETSTRWKDMRPGYHGGFYGHLWVPTLSLDKLIQQFFGDKKIDFASIDTEGSSTEIAIVLMRSDWRPQVLCVEHDSRQVEIMSEAKRHGYKAVEINQQNMVLCR